MNNLTPEIIKYIQDFWSEKDAIRDFTFKKCMLEICPDWIDLYRRKIYIASFSQINKRISVLLLDKSNNYMDNKTKLKHFYNTMDIDLGKIKCYKTEPEEYWNFHLYLVLLRSESLASLLPY